MNPLLTAWETTVDDVKAVLSAYGGDPKTAERRMNDLDLAAISKAAMYGSTMDEQLDYAYSTIAKQLGLTDKKSGTQ